MKKLLPLQIALAVVSLSIDCLAQTELSIAEAGAVGDGTTLNTKAIQAAIDRMASSGGTVVVPKGEFLTGAVFLKPKVNLRLDEGGVIKGSTNIADYPKMRTRIEGQFVDWTPALLNADQCDGLRITGPGTLDGNGQIFWTAFWDARKADPKVTNLAVERPRLVFIRNSKDMQVSGFSSKIPGFGTCICIAVVT
jgi:polygalacturonase